MKDFIRVAAVSPEVRVGNVSFNAEKTIEFLAGMKESGAEVVLFPELSLTSYSGADIFHHDSFYKQIESSIESIAEATKKYSVSTIIGLPLKINSKAYNCALFISYGKVIGAIPKTYLPNTQEFYEARWFTSGSALTEQFATIGKFTFPIGTDMIFEDQNSFFTFGIEICEDLWVAHAPSNDLSLAGAKVIFNPSASPEMVTKANYRKHLVEMQSAKTITGYVYASAGASESTTDVVYSSHCLITDCGSLRAESDRLSLYDVYAIADIDLVRVDQDRVRNSSFSQQKNIKVYRKIKFEFDITEKSNVLHKISKSPFVPSSAIDKDENFQDILNIQSAGLAKRYIHSRSKKLVLGLSGGLDSTLAALVCIETLKKLNKPMSELLCISMPGMGTSGRTKGNSQILAEAIGAEFMEIPILESVRQHFKDIGHDENLKDVTYENSQARERTQILFDIANKMGGVVVGTGDLSELALGWCTYNGDHMSSYAVNAGVPKTLVREIITWYLDKYAEAEFNGVLKDILDTPVSPELLPADKDGNIAQITEELVGPYILHDFFLYYFLRFGFGYQKILFLAKIAFVEDFDESTIAKWLSVFFRRFFSQQFKRSALPDGPKLGSVALSPRGDLRLPSDFDGSAWYSFILG